MKALVASRHGRNYDARTSLDDGGLHKGWQISASGEALSDNRPGLDLCTFAL